MIKNTPLLATMNGHHHMGSQGNPDDFPLPPRNGLEPRGNVVVESYRQDIKNGFEKQPIHNAMNPDKPQSSALVDVKDPIQIHLLTETALSDSKEYEILSQEEIDGLKKQVQVLTQRLNSTRSNLLIQAKFRDAANSMAKLDDPARLQNGDQNALDAEAERQATERRCEDLAAELFYLEKRLMEPKRRLLEHTAGILQLTHKASQRNRTAQNGQPLNGVPGSPESLYTYTHGRNSLDNPDEFYTDTTNFHGLDQLEGLQTKALKNPLEVPLRSPVREQHTQMKEELERMREENAQLTNAINDMEHKLEGLNGSLRETIVRFNPAINGDFDGPPSAATARDLKLGDMLRKQIDYMESGLVAVQAEQESYMDEKQRPRSLGISQGGGDLEAALNDLWNMIQSGYTEIRARKEERRRARAEKGYEDDDESDDDLDLAESYSVLGFTSRVRWLYRQATVLKDQKSVLKRQIKQQRELNNKSDAEKDAELAEKQEELDQNQILIQRAERDAMDAQQMLSEALEDLEQARQAANTVQNSAPADSERTRVLEAKLEEMQGSLDAAEADSQVTQQRLAHVDSAITALSTQLDEATESRDRAEARTGELQQRVAEMEQELAEKHDQLNDMEGQLQNQLHERHEELKQSVMGLQKQLAERSQTLKEREEELQRELAVKNEVIREREEEFEALNSSFVELKTEVTIARAELDGAYGTRAERAADAAAIKTSGDVARLQIQVDQLRSELAATVKDLEDITKETIGSEREKVELEGKLDDALSVKTSLESELTEIRNRLESEMEKSKERISQLQEDLDSERLKAGSGASGRPGAGASMLSEQFRTTLREERKKFQDELKEERTRSRKIEEELGRLKRAQGPGKSPLSPRP